MEQRILRIVNVPLSASVKDLRSFFSEVPIKRVRILGGPQEVAFILLSDQDAVLRAFEKHHTVFQENIVSISLCSPDDMRSEVEVLFPGYYSKLAETAVPCETPTANAELSQRTNALAVNSECTSLKRQADVLDSSSDRAGSKKLAMEAPPAPSQYNGPFPPRMPYPLRMSYPPRMPYSSEAAFPPMMSHPVRGHWRPAYQARRPFRRPSFMGPRGRPPKQPRFG